MPSYASQVLPDDRWRVILYVRQFQEKGHAMSSAPQTLARPAEARAMNQHRIQLRPWSLERS